MNAPYRILVSCTAALLCCLSPAQGDSLRDLQKSKAYKKAISNRRETVSSLYNGKWFDKGTWFGKIFLDEEGASYLFTWLGTERRMSDQRRYTGTMISVTKEEEYISAVREYVTPTFKKIRVTFVVPHPRSASSCRAGLIDACRVLIPGSEDRFESTVKKGSVERSEFIKTVQNTCMYITPLPRDGTVQLFTEHCADVEELHELYGLVDFPTLFNRMQN